MASDAGYAGEKALRAAIQSRVFAPVYLLHGADEFRKEEALRQLIAAASDPATRDFNLELRRGSDLDAETLGSLLATPPMMADRRVVVVRDVGALRREARAALDRYIESPAADVVLVMTAVAGAKEDRALLSRSTAVELEPLSGARIPKWITHYASEKLGCELTPGALALLQDAVGTDLSQLKTELDKLANFVAATDRKLIDEDAVASVVGIRRGETLGDLLDAIGRRNAAAALELAKHVMQQPKTTAVSVVMALTTQMLAVAWARALRERGTAGGGRLEQELFGLLRESGGFTGRSWTEAVKAWSRMVDMWSPEELDAALEALLFADIALKESRISSEEQVLAQLVLTLCGSEGAGGTGGTRRGAGPASAKESRSGNRATTVAMQ
jgi:DNA polymerase-3 subunit delta